MWTLLLLLGIMCGLIWFPVIVYQIISKAFVVLLIWLFISPIASNLLKAPGANPFYLTEDRRVYRDWKATGISYLQDETSYRFREIVEPTRVLILTIVGFMLLNHLLKLKQSEVALDLSEIWMGVFVLLAVLNAATQSIRVAYGLRTVCDAFAIPFLSYFVMRRLLIGEEQFQKFIRVFALLAAYLILIGFYERSLYPQFTFRLSGPFDIRDAFYLIMMTIFFAVLTETIIHHLTRGTTLVHPALRIFVLVFSPVMILFVWTRGCWLGFILGLWTFVFFGRRLLPWRQKLVTFGLLMLLIPILLGFGLLTYSANEETTHRIGNTKNIFDRFRTYEFVLEEAAKHPFFGIGLNNLRNILAEKQIVIRGREIATYRFAHQSYIALLAELGMVGFVAYLGAFGCLFKTGYNSYRRGSSLQERWRGVSMMAVLVAYCIPANFDDTLYQSWPIRAHMFIYFGAIVALSDAQRFSWLTGSFLLRERVNRPRYASTHSSSI